MREQQSLNESDLEEIFERSSGPGGQNVNKTSTKVLLRHLPTGLSVTVQDTRSQAQNRALARERLLEALAQRQRERAAQQRAAIEKARRQKRRRPAGLQRRLVEGKRKRGALKRGRTQKDFD